MKFLVDRCVGLRVAEWLQAEGHDAKRVVGPDPGDLELLRRRILQMWAQASRWPGPTDHPGYRAAVDQGMVSEGPEAIRARVRDWLSALLLEEGQALVLKDPDDWSAWDEEHRR